MSSGLFAVTLGPPFVLPATVCSAALTRVGAVVMAPLSGDLFLTGAALDGSARGFAGALAFLATGGGIFSVRALATDSGRTLWEGTLPAGRLIEGARRIA